MMQELPQADTAQLKQWSATKAQTCNCSPGACAGWESITESRRPAVQMQAVGTLRQADVYEPTFEEHHPKGTRCFVRYTEYGGYYVDHRARSLTGAPIADV